MNDRKNSSRRRKFFLTTKRLFDRLNDMIKRFNEVIASLESIQTTELEIVDLGEALDLAIRIKSMSEAVYLGILAEIEDNDFANSMGFRTAADAAAAKSGERRGSAKRDVELAKDIKAQPALSEAFGSGDLTRSKAAEILRAEGATDEEQRALIEAAKTESTSKLHRRVEDFRSEHGQEPPKGKNSLNITRNDSGGSISASLEPVRLNTVEIALDMAIKKLGLPKDIPYDERRAEGLAAICRFFIEHVDNASTVRGSKPHVSVIIDLATLEGRANKPSRLENGQYITGEAARQICCDAGITRIVTDPRSQPLDVGTQGTGFTVAMSRAIIARDKHCVHEGCEAPPWACEIHHKHHRVDRGKHSVENGELRCWYHHDHQHAQDAHQKRQHGTYANAA
jgi:Domain of unknown function (DUF222)